MSQTASCFLGTQTKLQIEKLRGTSYTPPFSACRRYDNVEYAWVPITQDFASCEARHAYEKPPVHDSSQYAYRTPQDYPCIDIYKLL